jgi:tetrahydromethanopterin S-methyltransferase subunit B
MSNNPINERVAKLEQWSHDHEDRHARDEDALLLAMRNEIALSAASSSPINAVLKWVAGLIALILVALLGWLLRAR